MPVSTLTPSQRTAARIAGLAWLVSFIGVVVVSFNIFFPLNEVASATDVAQRVLADETLFRLGIAGYLVNSVGIVLQLAALYVILEPVDRFLALLAAAARLVWAFTWVVVAVNLFMALALVKEGQPVLARLYLNGTSTYYVGLLFWAVAAGVNGYLWFRSRYVSRAWAALGVMSSAWCVACTLAYYVFAGFASLVNLWWVDSPMVIFELALSGWLLFIGLKSSKAAAVSPARL